MKALTVISTGDGMARVKNPFSKINAGHYKFNATNPPIPVFQNGVPFLQSGEFEAKLTMQEHLPFYNENEWTYCEVDGHDPIVTTGAITRQIFEIITPKVVGDEKKVENDQSLTFAVADKLDGIFQLKYIGSDTPVYAYELESALRSVLDELGYELKQPTIATTENVPVINEVDNSQSVDKQLVRGTEKTDTGKDVEALAAERYPFMQGKLLGQQTIRNYNTQMNERRAAFIAGHTAATRTSYLFFLIPQGAHR